MSPHKEIFEDPRTDRRKDEPGLTNTHIIDDKKVPETEKDWYLKRKPIVNYIGQKNGSVHETTKVIKDKP